MSALDDRTMIIYALCGPNADVDCPVDELLGLALELVVAEAVQITDLLYLDYQGLGYALAGKLKALSLFLECHVETTLVPIEERAIKGIAKVGKPRNRARRVAS